MVKQSKKVEKFLQIRIVAQCRALDKTDLQRVHPKDREPLHIINRHVFGRKVSATLIPSQPNPWKRTARLHWSL